MQGSNRKTPVNQITGNSLFPALSNYPLLLSPSETGLRKKGVEQETEPEDVNGATTYKSTNATI